MEPNIQNSSGMMNGMPPQQSQPQHDKKVGPIVGALVIVILLIIAAVYFFGSRLNTQPVEETAPVTQTSSATVSTTPTPTVAPAAKADDVNSLDADLNATMKDVDYSF